MTDPALKYWAADESDKCVSKAIGFVELWHAKSSTANGGLSSMWMRNTVSYYSAVLNTASWETSLSMEGEQGELVKMVIPRARKLIRQIISLSTQQRLDFQTVSMTQDMESVNATRVAQALASQLVEEQDLEIKGNVALEKAMFMGTGFIKTTWRTDKGMPYAQDVEGKTHYNGDVCFSIPNVYDVIYDTSKQVWSDQDWVVVRQTMNRWDLVAQFPELRDEILVLPSAYSQAGQYWWFYLKGRADDDAVFTYEFYHKPTPALPQGRMMMFSDKRTVYHDGINLYECLPIDIMQPELIHDTGFGYPIFSDLLPAQEMLDHSYSAIATNQAATAVQMYAAPRGSDISPMDIGGMNFLLYTPQNVPGGGKPEGMQLTQSAPETFKFADAVEAQMMKLAQLNNALIGEPNPGVTAGNAIATLTSNALRFMDPYIKTYSTCLEGAMTKAIMFYKKFATTERTVSIVGRNNKEQVRQFQGSDLATIKRMKLKIQSPMLQTIGGRLDIAEKLMPTGLFKEPQKLISILDGSPLDSLYADELSENDLIQQERDMMLDGKTPTVLATQNHPAHVRCHAADLNDQNLLQNHDAVAIYLQHIQQHVEQERSMDPFLKALCRTGVAPEMPPQPQGPPPVQGPSPGGGQNPGAEMMPTAHNAQPAQPAKPLV